MTPDPESPRFIAFLSLSMIAASLLFGAPAQAVVFTGELRARNSEAIYVPPSNSSPVVLRFFVPEGTRVAPGDALVRIDPGESASLLRSLASQIEQTRARAAKELAELQVRAIDAEIALVDARAALAKAEVDAGVPREYLSALEADRYAGERERAEREAALKASELAVANEAVERRRSDAELEVAKLQADLTYHTAQVANSEQRAERAGVVVHGFDSQRGQRFDEGSSAYPGNKVGEVVGDGGMEVRGWVLEPDREPLSIGDRVEMSLDALPGRAFSGRIERIAGAPEGKAEWGDGRYFSVDIQFEDDTAMDAMRPGMSVRIDSGSGSESTP